MQKMIEINTRLCRELLDKAGHKSGRRAGIGWAWLLTLASKSAWRTVQTAAGETKSNKQVNSNNNGKDNDNKDEDNKNVASVGWHWQGFTVEPGYGLRQADSFSFSSSIPASQA